MNVRVVAHSKKMLGRRGIRDTLDYERIDQIEKTDHTAPALWSQ